MLVDSGAWIALVRSADQYHAEADQLFRCALRDRIALLTTNLILSEVHRFLLFYMGIRPASLFLERTEASAGLVVEYPGAAQHEAACGWLARLDDQKISYTDAVSFAVMESSRCTAAMTFDHDFELAGFQRWRTQ